MRILLIRNGALGDVILTTPIVRHLAQIHNTKIDIITGFPQVFHGNPYVQNVSPCLPQTQYNQIYNLNMCYENIPTMHITDAYGQFVFCNQDFDHRPELFSNQEQQNKAASLLSNIPPFVVLHMRKYGWPNRNFSQEFWQKAVRDILTRTNYHIVQIGQANEISFTGHDRLHDLRGNYDIQTVKEVINAGIAFLGVDTATLHIAACTNTPIISIFTSAHHELRKPTGNKFFPILPHNPDGTILDCYGCQRERIGATDFYCKRGDVICTQSVSPADFVENLLNI